MDTAPALSPLLPLTHRVAAAARPVLGGLHLLLCPMALAVAVLQFQAPPLAYLPTMLLTTLAALVWHLWLIPRWMAPPTYGSLLKGSPPAWWCSWQTLPPQARRRVHVQDVLSLKWYVLAWWPFGGAFVALAAVLHHRVRARRTLGMTHTEALAHVLVCGLPPLAAIALGQWLIQGVLFAFPLFCEGHPQVCGLR